MPSRKIAAIYFFSFFAFQTVSELSVYIREETFLLQHEITSLEKVISKLEQEIQEADETKG